MSKTIFLAAIDMNQPLRQSIGFQALLLEKGFTVDMFVVAEGSWKERLSDKLDRCSFIWVTSLESLELADIQNAILDRVSRGTNLFVNFLPCGFSSIPEKSDPFKMNMLTKHFGIHYTGVKLHSMNEKREMTFGLECLQHEMLFEDVNAVSLSSPWHLEVAYPAKAAIVGDESCEGLSVGDRFVRPTGNDLVPEQA
jgi:hypothetical protein